MKVFECFNQDVKCMLCGKNTEGKAVLLPIDGTKDGNIERAIQVHLDCIDLRVAELELPDQPGRQLIYQIHDGPLHIDD